MEAFSNMRAPNMQIDIDEVRRHLRHMCDTVGCPFSGDTSAVAHYRRCGDLIWVSRLGVNAQADTLVSKLRGVGKMGFAPDKFWIDEIAGDIDRVRTLRYDDGKNTATRVMARLEFNLTMAMLRYAVGQRYGFTDPRRLFNSLDTVETTPPRPNPIFKKLYAIETERPNGTFVQAMLQSVRSGRLSIALQSAQPTDTLYYMLQRRLASAPASRREALLCNMERLRWRHPSAQQHTSDDGRSIMVNVPAFHLYAHCPDSILDMRIGCGTRKHKTPLLHSQIERMEVNPEWHIPFSIIKREVAPRAGDTAYFARNRYSIIERASGKRMPPADVSANMLRSGRFKVVQERGAGNSLGRIIFRFDNEFAVYLHDTSSRGFFSRNVRSVSHGCVRVQKPFELAQFLLRDADDWTLDKLRISIDMEPQTERGKKMVAEAESSLSLIRWLSVKPPVPVTIDYYTVYPDEKGRLQYYNDVYGYDKHIIERIKPLTDLIVKD